MALRFSLKSKISMVVFFLVAGVLMISGAIFFHYFERSLIKNISDQQFTLVTKLADEIDTSIGIAQEIISRTAARITPEIMGDSDLAQSFLDDHLHSVLPIFDNGVFLFSAKGLMVAETPFIPGRRGKDYSFRDYVIQTVATDHPLISTPYFSSQVHGHPAVNFTVPVHDNNGGVIGLLAGSLDLTQNNMLGRLANTKIGKTGYLYLYSTDRLMIMHPNLERLLKKDVPPGANLLFDRAIDGFEGSGETVNSRGLSFFSSFKRLNRVNWILAANYPRAEVYAPVVKAQNYFVFGLILSLLVATLVAWLAMQRLVAPLQYFIGHIEGAVVNRENLKPLEVGTGDEISTLADAFIRLMHEITVQKQTVEQQLLFQKILIDTIPNPIYYKNQKGEYLGCNKAFEQLYNCTDDEIIGAKIDKFVPMEMAKVLGDADAELYRQQAGEFQIFEYAATYADGSYHDLLFYKALFRDVTGNPAGLVGTIVDITERKSMERALYEEQKFAENLLKNSAVPSFVLDMNHKVLVWTTACEELTGMAAGELIGTDDHWKAFYPQKRPCLADLVIDRDIERTLDYYTTFSNSQLIPEGLQAEGWFPDIRGKRRYLRFEAAPIYDSTGALVAAVETLNDLTSFKQIEQALRESEQSYRSLIERAPNAIIVHRSGTVILANPSAARLFSDQDAEVLVGQQIIDFVHPDYRELVLQRVARVENHREEQSYIEETLFRADGSTVEVEASSTPVYYGGELSVQTILRDITERKLMQERIWRQANYDILTGLPNRFMFLDRLQQALVVADHEHHDRVALMFIDLDHFKAINDTLGHEAGDILLRQVADRLKQVVGETGTVSRIGGDEFTVILPRVIDPATVRVVVQNILDALSSSFTLPGGEGNISGSVGITFYPEDGGDISTLMKRADAAMYKAKQSGRDSCCFSTLPENISSGKRQLD